jgi:serine/threonine protein kinase
MSNEPRPSNSELETRSEEPKSAPSPESRVPSSDDIPSAAVREQETVTVARPVAGAAAIPPELIDHPRYRVVRLLGQGGMGAVYLAEHRVMERPVALKVMRTDLVRDAASVDRFRREVRAAACLSHPNIVTAYDAEQVGALHFLVMEYVEGTDLARRLALAGPLPVAEACSHIRQAALGLHHAFEQGMIHRDIKPHNLMLARGGTNEPFGRVKILDFGLARFANASSSAQTVSGMILGTVDFMAPEQADDARTVDTRADIYSLGCSLYYLLTGRVPFPDGTLLQKMLAQRERAPEPVSQYRTDVPPLLLNVLARLMAKKPEERYQTPAEVAQVLEPFLDPSRMAAPKPIVLPEVVEPLPTTLARSGAKPTVLELAEPEPAVRPPSKGAETEELPRPRRKRRFVTASCLLGCLGLVALIGGAGYLGFNVVTAAWERISDTFGFIDETAAWQRLERDWRPPLYGADEDIFPARFGGYSRSYIDDKATVAALDLNRPGKHAHYKGQMWDVDVYVFGPVSQADKETLYQKLIDRIAKEDRFGESLHGEQARLRNSPQGSKLVYDTFGAGTGRQRGCFWWKDGWLFLLRSEPIDDPEVLLRKLLNANNHK